MVLKSRKQKKKTKKKKKKNLKNVTGKKVKIDKFTILEGDFKPTLPKTDRSSKNLSKSSEALKTKFKLYLIKRSLYPEDKKYLFLSSIHRTFLRTDHKLDHKGSLKCFNKYIYRCTLHPHSK